ncbi:histidine triad (HIT) family protein [Entomoplasma freundtii]|uniref:Histidine triad protein n=1 Tax=Entomoplasma freundtii TaxID=74700 RepID=A0A2K8NS02_9MOLU|nr:HIT family protein [Entomoplasma freundtii]ATZ16534.1 histidine triad protein [Entomoplasma freundtii]TDY58300.1 histidine triad (HIT) family protein [Entomoplasma freundtii]
METTDCLFCKIVRKEIPASIIYEDDATLAFLDIHPTDNGHTLVIPKKHTSSFSKTDELTICAVTKAKKVVAELLQTKLKPNGFNFVTNDGAEAFQEVFHYHEHVIPKYKKNQGYAPERQPFKAMPLMEVCDRIK